MGSHVDTAATGGAFDGTRGVLAGIESLLANAVLRLADQR
jgi:hypothetical protein